MSPPDRPRWQQYANELEVPDEEREAMGLPPNPRRRPKSKGFSQAVIMANSATSLAAS
jgi:hypothetical protein